MTENHLPLVSIIMPSFNSARFIGEAINSVQKQTYTNWELLIVDDRSTDGTDNVVKQLATSDPRIRFILTDSRLGIPQSRNLAMRRAQGRFIAFLDSDDMWLPDKLAVQVQCMVSGGYAFTYTSYRRISQDGQLTGRLLTAPQKITYHKLLYQNVVGALTVMVDHEQVGAIEMANEKAEDFLTWLAILKKGHSVYGIQQDLARYRVVGKSDSRNKFLAALWVWRVYRKTERLGLLRSMWCFANYFARSLIKYSSF
jgi:teichuronic acid biosynthesis glycosyltransferase TuaG